MEQYKKDKDKIKKDERNSRWTNSNANSNENSERAQNTHKRAESFNIKDKKRPDDILNETKEEEKINL